MTTILFVDDDDDVRETIADALVDSGYNVITARHGAEAWAHLESATILPDLILLDLMMPVMDGAEFRERQRNDPRFQSIPVVLISAGVSASSQAKSMGVAACLIKPVKLSPLVGTIENVIAGGAPGTMGA